MEDKYRLKSKRLIVADIPEELHTKVKAECALLNISIRKYIIRAIVEKQMRDEKYK